MSPDPLRVDLAATGDSRIAVVMITHNRRPEVIRTLGYLTLLPERPQIVVVDNASTDDTLAHVAAQYPQMEILDAGGNVGAAARTVGVRHVKAPYVALCDDDTWWDPGSLARASYLFDKCSRLAVITGSVLVGPENRLDPTCLAMEKSPLPRHGDMPGEALLGFLAGASVVRRSAFLEAGGFHPRFFIGGEEELLAIDLVTRGWWLCYVPELVVHHYPSKERDASGRRWQSMRNALWSTWLRRPIGSAMRRTMRTARAHPWDAISFRGFAAAVAGLPWVLRERKQVPVNVEKCLRRLESQGF